MVDFHGWTMPLNYGSQLDEHKKVRNSCGIFDVSHMTIIDIGGNDAKKFLRKLLANDVTSLNEDFDGLYTALLDDSGYIIDDLIVYKLSLGYRLVVNCATRKSDISWITSKISDFEISVNERRDLSIISIQGPKFLDILSECFSLELSKELMVKRPFQGLMEKETLITTTGYTGEKGVEIMISNEKATPLWEEALNSGASPIGLGARDTLRLEAGMNLYGFEMDNTISPLESNMAWTVSLDDKERDFIGKKAYERKKEERNYHVLKGLLFEDRCIVRSGHEIYLDEKRKLKGIVTSGTYSPTLKKSIALARIPHSNEKKCFAEVRGKIFSALLGEPRFVREGKVIFKENIS
tara:strand:- start:5210 stop:6262 length:1053 start_codon:yes stop_codon:yes gene_type:complete